MSLFIHIKHSKKLAAAVLFCGAVAFAAFRFAWRIGRPTPVATIGIAGDVMIGRSVSPVIRVKGNEYPWGNMINELRNLDLFLINLETTLTRSRKKVFKVFNFKSDPKNVASLVAAGVDVVSLANNHAMDFSTEGLFETLRTLNAAGIQYVGAGSTIQEAQQAAVFNISGVKIGIIGFTDNEPGWLAGPIRPGTNYCRVGDIATVRKVVNHIRDSVDIVIASWHWGPNKREVPTPAFVHFAHDMIDGGIDIIHGHSAHVTQGIEIYKGKIILYDTGDFVDDYMVGPVLRNDQSFLFKVGVSTRGIESVHLIPVLIDNMQVNRAQGCNYRQVVERMKRLSSQWGTHLVDRDGYVEVTL